MSSSGITPINSGPLTIRTYLGNSINNTYVLGDYEYPVSSNRILITSTAGLLAPSDNIYISSITVSSINGGSVGPTDDVFWSLVGSTVINDNPGNVQITSSLVCSSLISVSTINGQPYPPGDDAFWSQSGNNIYNDNTGNVGIGTITPQEKLDVSGNIYSNGILRISTATTNANGAIRIFSEAGSSWIESGSSFSIGAGNKLKFTNMDYSISPAVLTVDTVNSYVGVKNENPAFTLDIVGREKVSQFSVDTATADATLIAANSPSGRAINFLTNCTAGAYNSITNVGDLGIMFSEGAQDTGNLWIGPWASGGAKGIKILNNGNVGIANGSPVEKLDVNGNLFLRPPGAIYTVTNHLINEIKCEVAAAATSGSGTKLHFVSYGFPTIPTLTVDTTNARVGINETTPVYPLDVNGAALFRAQILDYTVSPGIAGQVLTTTGTQIAWANPLAPLASGTQYFLSGSASQTITLGFNITANADIQLTWYNDNAATTQNPIYVQGGNLYAKQVWWNPVATTQFAIQIGPSGAGDGPNSAQVNHIIKWAVYSA